MLTQEHGVPEEHVKVLVRAFGAYFPSEVDGPGPAIRWLLTWLPWERSHPLLRKWYSGAVKRSQEQDRRLEAVLDLLQDDVDLMAAARARTEAVNVASALASAHGASSTQEWFRRVALTKDANPTERVWAGALTIADAAQAAARRQDKTMVSNVFGAVCCMTVAPGDGLSAEVLMDGFVQDTVAALVEYVCTWTGQWSC
jgi:hypothetical protein